MDVAEIAQEDAGGEVVVIHPVMDVQARVLVDVPIVVEQVVEVVVRVHVVHVMDAPEDVTVDA